MGVLLWPDLSPGRTKMIISLLLLSLAVVVSSEKVSSEEVEYQHQRGKLVPSHLFNKIAESAGYLKKRAWNSGFHTGMGKRHGNRMTDVKRYIDWLTGYPGKRQSLD